MMPSGDHGDMRVWIDLAQGAAFLGSTRLPVAVAGVHGELLAGGPQGTILRPLLFLERSRAALHALQSTDPALALSAEVLQLATVHRGEGDPIALEALAMVMAGALVRSRGASYAETALAVGRAGGWDLSQIETAEAYFIDYLSEGWVSPSEAAEPWMEPDQDGWTKLLFNVSPQEELDSLRRSLADGLLQRAKPPAAQNTARTRNHPGPVEAASEPPVSFRLQPAGFTPSDSRSNDPLSGAGNDPAANGAAGGGPWRDVSALDIGNGAMPFPGGFPVSDTQNPLQAAPPFFRNMEAHFKGDENAVEPAAMGDPVPETLDFVSNEIEALSQLPVSSGGYPMPAYLPADLPAGQRVPASFSPSGLAAETVPGVYADVFTPVRGLAASSMPAVSSQAEIYDLSSLDEVADALAARLQDEADLRGIDP